MITRSVQNKVHKKTQKGAWRTRTYIEFLTREKLLTNKLMQQNYQQSQSSVRKLYGT